MKLLRYLSLTVLSIGVLVYVGSILAKRQTGVQRRPFILTTASFKIISNGPPILEHISTRFARSSSYWKEVSTDIKSQTVSTKVAKEGNVYEVGAKKKEWLSTAANQDDLMTPENLRNHPQFARTEQLLGLTTYVHRHSISPEDWSEMWFAPETGRVPLKIHINLEAGRQQNIVEPLSLTFGDIPDNVFEGPDLPTSFSQIEKLIESAEKQGHHEFAESMRRSIEAQRQSPTPKPRKERQ